MAPGLKGAEDGGRVPGRVFALLCTMGALTVIFSALVLVIPAETFRLYSNSLEVAVALFCMLACLYAYSTWSQRTVLLLAAFAFGGFALSNTFWYLYSIALGRQYELVTISELGFLGFSLFFIVAFRIGFIKIPCPVPWRAVVPVLYAAYAGAIAAAAGVTLPAALALFDLLIVALLLDTAISRGLYRSPLLFAGTCLWGCASAIYGLREVGAAPFGTGITAAPAAANLVGPLDILAFLFLLAGLFTDLNSRTD